MSKRRRSNGSSIKIGAPVLNLPRKEYEAADGERKSFPLRLGQADRARLDDIAAALGTTRTRFMRVIIRVCHQELHNNEQVDRPNSRLTGLLKDYFHDRRTDRNRRRRLAYLAEKLDFN
jgi:hypothetical protein